MKADEKTYSEVMKLITSYTSALASGNVDNVMALKLTDSDLTFVGSGPDEWRRGTEQVREQVIRDLSQSEKLVVRLKDLNISSNGNVAWLVAPTGVCATVHGKEIKFNGRFSAVVEKRDGEWKIAQIHFSMPSTHHLSGQSFPYETIDYFD